MQAVATEPGLHEMEALFGGIQVGRVRRKVYELGSVLFNNYARDLLIMVDSAVVHYNNTTWSRISVELRRQMFAEKVEEPILCN